jgi:hypothetical protein
VIRALLLVVTLLGAAGCAAVRPEPARRGAWAFYADPAKPVAPGSTATLGSLAFVYARSMEACQKAQHPRAHSLCEQVTVTEGADYYALALPSRVTDVRTPDTPLSGVTVAVKGRERCEAVREAFIAVYGVMGDCAPVGVSRRLTLTEGTWVLWMRFFSSWMAHSAFETSEACEAERGVESAKAATARSTMEVAVQLGGGAVTAFRSLGALPAVVFLCEPSAAGPPGLRAR